MKHLCVGLVAAWLGVLVGNGFGQDKVRVGLSSVSALHGALWVAEQKGILRKHGIEAEVIVVGGAGTTGVSALLANDIQYVSAAGDAIVNSNLRGGDTVMIASVINKGFQRLVVRSDIKTPAEIKGKRIAVTRVGAISHTVLLMILRRWGMTEKDIQIVQLGSMATKFYDMPPYPSLRGVETVLGFVEKDNPKAKGADPKSFVDDTLLREIEASGFIKTLYQR